MYYKNFLDPQEVQALNDMVAEAEKLTAGEIKVLVVQNSGKFPGDLDADRTQSRANQEFFELGLNHTQNSTGILIMISLDERRVEVRAGKAIDEFYDQSMWQAIVDKITSEIKAKDPAKGICEAIAMAGDILSEHFPIHVGDVNEIPNDIVFKE